MRVIAQAKAYMYAESPAQAVFQIHPHSFVEEIYSSDLGVLGYTIAGRSMFCH